MNVTPATQVTIPSGQFSQVSGQEFRSHETKTPVEIDQEHITLAQEEADLEARLAAVRARQARLDRAYDEVGGWTRAYLVNNTGGHVHSSTRCSSCYATTQFTFLADYSAQDQDEIIAAAGELACTVCYPDAPVNAGPGTIRRADQIAADARRQERAEKAAQATESKVVTASGAEYKSERAALNAASSAMSDVLFYKADHPSAAEWITTAVENTDAVAAKTGQSAHEIRHAMATRVARKALTEARKYNRTQNARQFGMATEVPVDEAVAIILDRLAVRV